jgi:The GLUG motif
MGPKTRTFNRMVVTLVVAAVLFGQICFAKYKYSGGSGTADDPYQIANADDVLTLSANTIDYSSDDFNKCFVLTADIDLNSVSNFSAAVVGVFEGVFDGAGHKISNLTVKNEVYQQHYLGFFGTNYGIGQIKNLNMENVSITGGDGTTNSGGIVGCNYGSISNCSSSGTITTGSAGSAAVGGLVGHNFSDGTISNCHSTCDINNGNSASSIGGLVGSNSGDINDCFSTGDINVGDDAVYIGGLAGYNTDTIRNCYSTGAVIGRTDPAGLGGLVGDNDAGSSISGCYATGDVIGGDDSTDNGGLAGYNFGTISNSYSTGAVTGGDNSDGLGNTCVLGGLVGLNISSISNCYSSGTVTGGSGAFALGGLVGFNNPGTTTINSSYFLDANCNNGLGALLTNTQMKHKANFVGWDFNSVWQIAEGVSYPKLAWQPGTTVISGIIDVTKCTVAAGLGSKGDSISFSGDMNATADDFNDANSSSDANFVEVTISDENSNNMDPCVITFPANDKTWKKGKFSYSGTVNGVKKSFSYVVKTGKFTFAASNINLSGLECPVIININVGNFAGATDVNEAIVNGKKPIPINLLIGVKNSLRVDKSKFTRNKTTSRITQLAISGGFSVGNLGDANMADNNSVVELAGQTFTIPKGNFKAGKNKFTCSKVNLYDGATLIGIATATFDFNKCTFTLTIKSTDFPAAAGPTEFDIDFASFSGSDVVTLPP